MQNKTEDILKLGIVNCLKLVKDKIEIIISEVESDRDWKFIHKQINLAIYQLNKATKQLAGRHLKIYIFRNNHVPNNKDLKEVFKIYKYLY